jgi:hypothetical protein
MDASGTSDSERVRELASTDELDRFLASAINIMMLIAVVALLMLALV